MLRIAYGLRRNDDFGRKMAVTCKKCGVALPEKVEFCPRCGVKVERKIQDRLVGTISPAENMPGLGTVQAAEGYPAWGKLHPLTEESKPRESEEKL